MDPVPAPHLLLIDDDQELCELASEFLRQEGFDVTTEQDANAGLAAALSGQHSLVVLDVMLPRLSGFEVLRQLRARSAVPVLMLTARGEDVDRIVGLEMGADDYLAKPFNPRELVARIRAILRRAAAQAAGSGGAPLVLDDVELDPGARSVRREGHSIALTAIEFDMLAELLRHAGQVVGREALSREVLGRPFVPFDRSVDMHVSNLRRKLGPHSGGGERIKTVRGSGYLYVRRARDLATL
jgi:two-component system response regulator CpxR